MSTALITDTTSLSDADTQRALKASKKRLDIQGLRAVCMTQVLLYHAWFIGSPIGVDAFIMISAFLMTSSFVRRSVAGQMPSVIERWGNTFKRLLPPLVLTIVATLMAALAALPQSRWEDLFKQSIASLTYWQNWLLRATSVDYYAQDHALSSPLQHLWSMSMQGQVFLLWPLLMAGCVLAAKRLGWRIRPFIFVVFSLLAAGSLTWLMLVGQHQEGVYFDTRARIWEFALGSALAAISTRLKLSETWAWIVSWVGLIVLVVYCLVSIGSYPGPMSAVPMLSAATILLFAHKTGDKKGSVGKVLSWKPLVRLGDISYAVYLIHWPVFVLYLSIYEKERLSFTEGVTLVVISIGLAWMMTKFVEKPLQAWKWAKASTGNKVAAVLTFLLFGMVPVISGFTTLRIETNKEEARLAEYVGDIDHPGAAVLLDEGFVAPTENNSDPIPASISLKKEWYRMAYNCDPQDKDALIGETRGRDCSRNREDNGTNVDIFVGGDSHAEQNLVPIAESLGNTFSLDAQTMLEGGCKWMAEGESTRDECNQWNASLLKYALAKHPKLVLLNVTAASPDSPKEQLVPGIEKVVKALTDAGITVIGFRDNLRSENNLYECEPSVEDLQKVEGKPYGGCLLARDQYFGDDHLVDSLLKIPGFYYVDMSDAYCSEGVCPTTIGNIHVYIDGNHVSKSYSTTMLPYALDRIEDTLGADNPLK